MTHLLLYEQMWHNWFEVHRNFLCWHHHLL